MKKKKNKVSPHLKLVGQKPQELDRHLLVVDLMADLRIGGRVSMLSIYKAIKYDRLLPFDQFCEVFTIDLQSGKDYGYELGPHVNYAGPWITNIAARKALMADRIEIGEFVRNYFVQIEAEAISMAQQLHMLGSPNGEEGV